MRKLLLVANVAKEHVLKFHVPTIERLSEDGWLVDVACGGSESVPFCRKQFELPIDRSPFNSHFVKAIKLLRSIIDEGRYDIIYCHTSVGGLVARVASRPFRKKGIRVIKFAHGTYFYNGAPLYNYILYYPLYKYLSTITDDIITITHEDFVFSKRHYRFPRIHYVHGIGIETSRFLVPDRNEVRNKYREDLNIPQSSIVLVYVAELIKNKNQLLLLQVLERVLLHHPDTYLMLIGPEHDDGKLKHTAKQLGIDEHVRFMGWRDDIPNLLAVSDICTASSIREGLGLNLVEAMAAGLPIIATNNSGHAEILHNDPGVGFLVPFDSAKFAERVVELINNIQLRTQMGEIGRTVCAKYDSKAILPQILRILAE